MTQVPASWKHLRIYEASAERVTLVAVVKGMAERYKKEASTIKALAGTHGQASALVDGAA